MTAEDERWESIAAGVDPRDLPTSPPAPGDCQPEFAPIPSGRPTAIVRPCPAYRHAL